MGIPNLKAFSNVFKKLLSVNVVILNFLALNVLINSVACPAGSIIKGYLLNLCNMVAFSKQILSLGNLQFCHMALSFAFVSHSTSSKSVLDIISFCITI